MAVAYSRYKFVTVSLPKRFRNGRFTSENATWIQKYFKKNPLELLESSRYSIIVFQGGDDGRGYIIEIFVKYPGGPTRIRVTEVPRGAYSMARNGRNSAKNQYF
jgi:hypothetical protein